MQLESILNMAEFKLPALNSTGRSFIVFAEQRMKEYVHRISTSPDLFDGCPPQLLEYKEFKDTVTYYADSLIHIIRVYNHAKMDEAYKLFSTLMEGASIFVNNHPGAVHLINKNDIFYRCKYSDQPALKPITYFFHTPFELRHKVKSTRFSFNGFPSLYLTNSIVVGYKETRAISMDNFQGVKFQSLYPLSFLDLDYTRPSSNLKLSNPTLYDLQLQIKGMIFPLLFCCYCIQNDPDAAAPQEYIIPQFLVRWVQENNRLYSGIKYPSTRINGLNYEGEFYNLIVPPIEIKDEGVCDKLKNRLHMSDVCSGSIHKLEIEDFFVTEYPKFGSINDSVKKIDWIAGSELYELTEVGKMEFYIKHKLVSKSIPF